MLPANPVDISGHALPSSSPKVISRPTVGDEILLSNMPTVYFSSLTVVNRLIHENVVDIPS